MQKIDKNLWKMLDKKKKYCIGLLNMFFVLSVN